MISAFSSALRMIYNTIPREILEATFRPNDYQITLDKRIQEVIVNGRVLPDCNINAGKIKRIPLSACMMEYVLPDPDISSIISPTPGSLYRVPPAARENRDIVGVIDISYLFDYSGFNDSPFGLGSNGNTIRSMAAAALNSHTGRNSCLTPTPTLLANNMILINPTNSFISDWALVCRLGYDDEFTNIANASITPLSHLITTATKAYIWVTLTIQIDAAMLSGGQELGKFKDIVDRYENEYEKYNEDLLKFRGSTALDMEAVRYFIRAMI
jgi:hypothetical protein